MKGLHWICNPLANLKQCYSDVKHTRLSKVEISMACDIVSDDQLLIWQQTYKRHLLPSERPVHRP